MAMVQELVDWAVAMAEDDDSKTIGEWLDWLRAQLTESTSGS